MLGSIFFNSITLLSLFVTIVLFIFFILTKRGNRSENLLLSALLFFFSLQIFYSFTVSTYAFRNFYSWHKELFLIRQTSLLTGLCIYLYLRSFSKKTIILNRRDILHVFPFIIVMVFLSFYLFTKDNFIIWKSTVDLYDTILILIYNLIYIVLSAVSINSPHNTFNTFLKDIKASSVITWLHMLLAGFIIIWIVNLNSFAIFMILRNPEWCAYTASIFALAVFLFMSSLMFLLLLKPEIYYVIEKYKNTNIGEISKMEYLHRLNHYMESRRPYLNPGLSLETIAKDLNLQRRILSQVINEKCNNNFKGYVNEFRIRESIRLLSQPENDGKTILEILYEVGFNSKSVFNDQFKRTTGLTPQEYRAKHSKRTSTKLMTADSNT